MKNILVLGLVTLLGSCASNTKLLALDLLSCPKVSAQLAPQILWSNSEFSNPESVVYDKSSKSFYVSNVAGNPTEKDGKGWISKLSTSGKTQKSRWAEGLHAPKGMRIRNEVLWVSDIDSLHGIQLRNRKKSIQVDIVGSTFLNDIAFLTKPDRVLVSDMTSNRIYSVEILGNGKSSKPKVFAEGRSLESPNGLLRDRDTLLVASWGNDIQADFSTPRPGSVLSVNTATSEVTPWTTKPLGNLDGIEMDGPDAILVSDWMAGKVFRVQKDGSCVTLLEGIKGAADIGFVPETRTLVVPAMAEDRVTAYKLPKY